MADRIQFKTGKFLLLLLVIVSNDLAAQGGLNWINYPTVDGISNIEEERMRHSRLVMGDVTKITATSFFSGDDEKEVSDILYSDQGNVHSLTTTNFDPNSEGGISSLVKYQFTYDEAQKIVFESVVTIIEGNSVENIAQRWPEYYPILPESLKTDTSGNSLQIVYFGDTTYSFYDEFGRKTMDSIPSDDKYGRTITYRYEGNKIYRECYYIGEPDELYEKEEYTVDEHGNWIELKYFGAFELEGDKPSQIYTREITYR